MNLYQQFLDLFRAPTIEEIILHETQKEELTIAQCDHTIRHNLLQKAMSANKVALLKAWEPGASIEHLVKRFQL